MLCFLFYDSALSPASGVKPGPGDHGAAQHRAVFLFKSLRHTHGLESLFHDLKRFRIGLHFVSPFPQSILSPLPYTSQKRAAKEGSVPAA